MSRQTYVKFYVLVTERPHYGNLAVVNLNLPNLIIPNLTLPKPLFMTMNHDQKEYVHHLAKMLFNRTLLLTYKFCFTGRIIPHMCVC